MCGIVGIHGSRAESADLSASLRALSLRGPDMQASLLSGKALLGHSRLSIIDTSSASDQPMQDPSGRYSLIFNGEIYNYRTLAAQLEEAGVSLRTHGDTEVLLHWLILYGIKGLQDLNGFFAFAFYDKEDDALLLARDRIGIKPLYYAVADHELIFGSELKAILPLLPEKTINPVSVDLFFQLNYIPAPQTIHQEVKQLLPGHLLEYRNGKTSISAYFKISDAIRKPSKQKENLHDLLASSVKRRLVADVPLGSFLSGGVDSSIIAALAIQEKKDLKTFSLGFADQAYFDESPYAEKVAHHISSDHQTFHIHEEELLHSLDDVLAYIDEPFADSSAIAVYALSRFARKHVTVALSGDGADELFGGYTKHQAHLRAIEAPWTDSILNAFRPLLSLMPSSRSSALGNKMRQVDRYLRVASADPGERFWAWSSWTSEERLRSLLKEEILGSSREARASYLPTNQSMEEVLLRDTELVLPNDMLVKVDRMSMANSLEVRVPFLDHEVVSYAHSLNADHRMSKGKGKKILREQFSHLLPAEIFERKKKGFEVPLESWFLGPLHSRLNSVLSDGLLAESGFFHTQELSHLSRKLSQKNIAEEVHLLWALMVFHSFLRKTLSFRTN
jgi:asparagine synthase (glutamine-hydrolysing)